MTRTANGAPRAALLAIDTAGSNCSAAVACDGAVVAAERQMLRHGHAEAILPMIDRVVTASGVARPHIAAVAAAVGPGGFTGIRVGLAAARAIALALNARPIGVTSFAAVAESVAAGLPAGARRLLVALDSRRAELYVQLFALCDSGGGERRRAAATPLAPPAALLPDRLAAYAAGLISGEAGLLLAGNAVESAAASLDNAMRGSIVADSAPDARGVAAAALRLLQEDAVGAPLRPLYLRPPDVSRPGIPPNARAAVPAP